MKSSTNAVQQWEACSSLKDRLTIFDECVTKLIELSQNWRDTLVGTRTRTNTQVSVQFAHCVFSLGAYADVLKNTLALSRSTIRETDLVVSEIENMQAMNMEHLRQSHKREDREDLYG